MRIAIGCDEAAYRLKMVVISHLETRGHETVDFGAHQRETVLYPDVASSVAGAVAQGRFERAILVCGTGIGMAIVANKVPGVRAAVCHDPFSAERSRKSNNAQIMCMGERVVGDELAKYLVDVWLSSDFEGGRSIAKLERIEQLEQNGMERKK